MFNSTILVSPGNSSQTFTTLSTLSYSTNAANAGPVPETLTPFAPATNAFTHISASYFNAADFLVSPDNGYMIMVSPDAVSILYNELAKDNCKTKQEYLTKLYKLQESGELDFYSAPNSRLFIVPTDQEPFERYRGLSLNKIEDLKEFEFQTGGSLSAYKRIIPKDSHLIQDI